VTLKKIHLPAAEGRELGALNRVPARAKLVVAALVITATALMPRRPDWVYLWPTALLLFLWLLSRMPVRYGFRRLLLAQFFIFGVALLSLIHPSSSPIVLSTIIKSNLCILTMLLLTWMTPFQEILNELRRLRLPSVMVNTLALMYRYLPVLADETRRMQRARTSRTFSRQRRLAWHNISTIIGQLFIRSTERAERIYLAMCARGWK